MSGQANSTPPDPGNLSWTSQLATIPSKIFQPFSLSATALVVAVFLGVFVSALTAIIALGLSIILLVLGLIGTPRSAVGTLVAGSPNFNAVSDIESDTPVASTKLTRGAGGSLTPLETVCFLHLYVREGGHVGRTRTFNLDYFVDLMSASLVPDHLEIMAAEFVDHIRRLTDLNKLSVLAGPKRGNSLLITATAYRLGLTPMLIKERPLFGKALEGVDGDPGCAAIIDDISSDGELLAISAQTMRDSGYQVRDAYVLIDRTEGDSVEQLAQLGITLHPLLNMDDHKLRDIVRQARQTAPRQ